MGGFTQPEPTNMVSGDFEWLVFRVPPRGLPSSSKDLVEIFSVPRNSSKECLGLRVLDSNFNSILIGELLQANICPQTKGETKRNESGVQLASGAGPTTSKEKENPSRPGVTQVSPWTRICWPPTVCCDCAQDNRGPYPDKADIPVGQTDN